ncbi:MAG: hypothetical protein KJO82_10765, partial [Gammaproteobacteria bacterium]|nr:hypothetical protein [Gammaproteobacteria bacterium]
GKDRVSYAPQSAESAALALRFDALGKRFELQLETNDRVVGALSADAISEGLAVYRGQLAGVSNSWARIVVFEGMPRGLIWDGAEMFAIEAPGDSELAIDTPVMYRLSDTYIAPGTMSCGSDSLSGNATDILKTLQTAAKTAVARGPGAVSEITMSAIGDFEFTTAKGGDSNAAAAITTRLNNVDGYFSEQVGVQINVQLIETHSNPLDPFGDTTNAGMLLDELSEYRLQTPAHNAEGVTHLYTGKTLDTTTVGIAWRGSLCDSYFSAGLSEGNSSVLIDSLIAAHEIGHNFGAEHDGQQGTSCADEVGQWIMSPSVSGIDRFSDCSIGVMQAEAAAASCVTALPTVDVGIVPVGQVSNVLLGASTNFEYTVSSNGTLDALAVMADFTLPSVLTLNSVSTTMGSCSSGAGTVSCDIGDLAGLSSSTVTITATPSSEGIGVMTAAVSTSSSDERPGNNQDVSQVTVDPAVDLVISTPTSSPVFIDAVTTVNATVNNVSTLDASDVALSITFENGLRPDSASWSVGSCSIDLQQVSCTASNFAAQSNSTLSITATGTSEGRKDVAISVSSTEADADPSNNSAQGEVRVVTENSDSDEGGGAVHPFLLLMLIGTLAMRRRS